METDIKHTNIQLCMLNNTPLMKNTFNFDVPELFPPKGAKHVFDPLMQ